MFATDESRSTADCADALVASVAAQRRLEAERLALVAHWADLHPRLEADEARRAGLGWTPYRSRAQAEAAWPAEEDVPAVSEFAAAELGLLLETTTTSAARLLHDALVVRHRLPHHWRAVMDGRVDVWKVRKVAHATAVLTQDQARWVDEQTVDAVAGLPFGRAMTRLQAKVIAADPEGHEERRRERAARRYVSAGRPSNDAGLRTLVAQTTAGDVGRLMAMVDHIAALLSAGGDQDDLPCRRATALGVLAHPAQACLLLAARHPPRKGERREVQARDEPPPKADETPVDTDEPAHASAVHQAVEVGRLLTSLGSAALDRLRPRTVLYVHVAEEAVGGRGEGAAVARVEAVAPVGVEELRKWLGTDQVVVRPVLDPAGHAPVDAYEVPDRMREALSALHPTEVWPWGTLSSRSADADHTVPYVPPEHGGPPGQTRLDNLGPLSRHHHNAKTSGGFSCHQPLPGLYLWQTPTGHWFQVDHRGSRALGRTTPAIIEQRRRPRPASPVECVLADVLVAV